MVTKKFFSTKSSNKLHPLFVTGYTDGEGSFSIRIRKLLNSPIGYQSSIVYSIGAEQNSLNLILLERIKEYFNGEGSISKSGNMHIYEISSIKSLNVVREHFEKYPLQTTKDVHFRLWCEVLDIIKKKEHLTPEGFRKILSIKSVFPKGLSSSLLDNYPNIVPINKPVFVSPKDKLDPNWIVGFAQADGTFGLNYIKQARMTLGFTCQPQFRITQHERDLIVLNRIIESMGCGTIVKPSGDRDRYTISVANLKDLITITIPLFQTHTIYGAKYEDFLDFCKGVFLLKDKAHLTPEGLKKLKDLVDGMNTGRKF